jgi:hypothetical protein
LKTVIINLAVLFGLFLLMETAVRIFVPGIKPIGVDSSLIDPQRFGDTPGLARSASGWNYGVSTRTTSDGFILYSTDLPQNANLRTDVGAKSGSGADTGRMNWLLLGDSVTMPIGVESDSSFAGRLTLAVSDSVRVLNSSLIGYSAFDYLNVAGSIIGLGEHPLNRVILFWCLNDVYGSAAGGTADAGNPEADVRRRQGGVMRLINRHLYLVQWLQSAASDREQGYFLFDRQFYSDGSAELGAALDRIGIIRDMAEHTGAWFDVIIMPYEYQYRSGDFHPQDVLISALAGMGISTMDARAAFDSSDARAMYIHGDGIHFSETGHRRMWHWLRENLLTLARPG